MSVSDNDLELLEQHLDGELDAQASADLNRRLVSDSTLSAALDQTRAQRSVRSMIWQSMDSDAAAGDRLMWRVRGAMLDQRQNTARAAMVAKSSWSSWRIAGIGSAAAACLMLGFMAGRVGHGSPVAQSSQMLAGNSDNNTGGGGNGMLASDTTITPHTPGQFNQVGTVPQVLVPISNEYGQVVRWQPFDNAEQAKSFEEDLHRAQGGTMNAAAAVAPRLASQEHF